MGDPYKPPLARIADPPGRKIGRPPWPVIVAIFCLVLLVVNHGIAIAGVISLRRFVGNTGPLILLISARIFCVGFVAWFLARRRWWACWGVGALAAVHAMDAASKFINYTRRTTGAGYELPWVSYAIWVIPALLAIAATALVFGPGRAWFERRIS